MQKLSSPIKLIKDSVKIFFTKENLRYFVSIYLVLALFQVLTYFQGSVINTSTGNIKNVPVVFVVVILNFIVYLLTTIAGIVAVKQVINGEEFNIKETFLFAWKNLWGFFLVSALVFLAIFGGMILLIIPGIIFGVWFAFAKFIYVDTGLGAKTVMGKSRELVKGRFWAILGRFIVFGVFSGLVSFVFSGIPYGIGSDIISLAGVLFILPSYLMYRELSV